MHRSRLAGFILDCSGPGLDEAARFWSEALGMEMHATTEDKYVELNASARDLHVEVQSVRHASRVHLDIETDDLDAEVARLEALGAREVERIRTWVVMEAPTGQRFCVVRAKRPLEQERGVTLWR